MKDFDHQKAVFEEAKDREFFGLLWEQGCGKTRVAIELAEHHYEQGSITAILVITTKGLVRNWSDVEIPAHAFHPYLYRVWPNKDFPLSSKPCLFYWFVNVDALRTEPFVTRFKEFIQVHPNFIAIVDESTIIKAPSAKRTKVALKIGRLAKRRLIMTGLPTPKSPLDIYTQCEFLKQYALGFSHFTQFKYRHAEIRMVTMGNRMFPEIQGYKHLGELKQKLSQFTSIIKKEDCLDLPPTSLRFFPVPLTKEQRKYYDELRKQMMTMVENRLVDAKNVISMINKCLQLCSGQIKLEDGTYLDVPTDRLDALEELVEECPGQSIVWTAFVHNAVAIGKKFGKDALLLPSGLTLDQRQTVLATFKSGIGKILVANPASAGHGITLTNCSNIIHYSRSFNFEHRAQADARIHRIGQTKPCLYTDLCDPKTLEMRVIKILTAKEKMSDFMLDGNFLRQLIDAPQEEYA
jgi:SNF2 family DNA or RNA helicase